MRVAMRGDGWGLEVEVRMKVRMGLGMLRVGGGKAWGAGMACRHTRLRHHSWGEPSVVIRSIGGHQWSSVVISGNQWSSVVISDRQCPSVVISGRQCSSVVISGHQWSSVVISGHQWSSVVPPPPHSVM